MTKIEYFNVPIDGKPHRFAVPGFARIVHVAPGFESAWSVSFWAEYDERKLSGGRCPRTFLVLDETAAATDGLPTGFRHVGTAIDIGLRLVWHLCEEVE